MIANWSYEKISFPANFSIVDAETGECLDKEGIRFADDSNGFYYRALRNDQGNRYLVFDPSNGQREVATELVHRKIKIVPRIRDSASCPSCDHPAPAAARTKSP